MCGGGGRDSAILRRRNFFLGFTPPSSVHAALPLLPRDGAVCPPPPLSCRLLSIQRTSSATGCLAILPFPMGCTAAQTCASVHPLSRSPGAFRTRRRSHMPRLHTRPDRGQARRPRRGGSLGRRVPQDLCHFVGIGTAGGFLIIESTQQAPCSSEPIRCTPFGWWSWVDRHPKAPNHRQLICEGASRAVRARGATLAPWA